VIPLSKEAMLKMPATIKTMSWETGEMETIHSGELGSCLGKFNSMDIPEGKLSIALWLDDDIGYVCSRSEKLIMYSDKGSEFAKKYCTVMQDQTAA
jgi:hypothetical protein